MKIMAKVTLSFVIVVLIFGAVMLYIGSDNTTREKNNTIAMYEERGVSIAKTIDATLESQADLNDTSQATIDKAMVSNIGLTEFNIHSMAQPVNQVTVIGLSLATMPPSCTPPAAPRTSKRSPRTSTM